MLEMFEGIADEGQTGKRKYIQWKQEQINNRNLKEGTRTIKSTNEKEKKKKQRDLHEIRAFSNTSKA